MIELIVAILIVVTLAVFITYILNFFSVIPASIMGVVMLGLALDLLLFIIHRKGN